MENDYYGIIGLGEKTFEASESEIKRAYQKAAIKHHPDKVGNKGYGPVEKKLWLKIQKAYETFTTPKLKKKYDSTLPFDNDLPTVGKFTDSDFFEVFNVVFKRNERFSVKKPCPNIGDINSSVKEVEAFYKFWNNFETWREWCQYDEHEITEDMERSERRHNENENKKVRATHEKSERKRLIKLAELSYDNDPRIKLIRKAEEDAKNAVKNQKKDFKSE